nr:hypothetical protein BdHM001_35110 [Bdellovibrio sp. HM001]
MKFFKWIASFKKWLAKSSDGAFGMVTDANMRPRGISRRHYKVIGLVIGGMFILGVILNSCMSDNFFSNSIDDYEKELRTDDGMKSRPIESDNIFDVDPIGTINNRHWNVRPESSSFSDRSQALDKAACLALLEKVRNGEEMSLEETTNVRTCVSENIAELSQDDLAIASALVDPNTPESVREELRNQWRSGQVAKTPEAKLVSKAHSPSTASDVAESLAKAGIDIAKIGASGVGKVVSKALSEPETKKAIVAADSGKKLSAEQKEAINEIVQQMAKETKKEDEGFSIPSFGGSTSGDGGMAEMKELSDQIKDKKQAYEEAIRELQEYQAQAKEAAKAMAQGKRLDEEQAAALSRSMEAQKKADELEKAIKGDQARLKELAEEIKMALSDMNLVTEEISDSVILRYGANERSKSRGKGGKKSEAINLPQVVEPPKENLDRLIAGPSLDLKRLSFNSKEQMDVSKLVMNSGEGNTLRLCSTQKFAAALDSEILVASNNSQQVRVKTISDIHDCVSGKLAIPAGSVLIGTTSGFNEETAVMDLTFSKTNVGGKTRYEFTMKVGSGDGSFGLKGNLYDTRGRKLLAALVTSFVGGAIEHLEQNQIARYNNSTNLGTALLGVAMGGAADVAKKIANMYASDLNNAPVIYHAPKGTPIILFPDDQ